MPGNFLKVGSKITIGSWIMPLCHLTETESSYELLTDTCTIEVPHHLQWKGKPIAHGESLFKRGMAVRVEHGYDGKLLTVFDGYISRIIPQKPLKIVCQDAMWFLKQKTIKNLSYPNMSLGQLLKDHCPIPFKAVDTQIGSYRQPREVTLAQVLEDLRDNHGLFSFIRNGILYAGLAYWPELQNQVSFGFGYNIIEASDLEYMRAEDVKVKVKAISINSINNSRTVVEVGDPDGETRTLYAVDATATTLEAWAKREIPKLKYEGYRGTFTTFGAPIVRHGDIVVIYDRLEFRPTGKYTVKKVTYKGGVYGLRQTIEVAERIDTYLDPSPGGEIATNIFASSILHDTITGE